jgi:PilZ domain-containing protein
VKRSCTVLIAAPDLLAELEKRNASPGGEVIAFTDADALKALKVITKRRPAVVVLERLFAATPRGAALINRIKADPSLNQSEIRIVSHDTDYVRVSPRRPSEAGSKTAAAVAESPAEAPAAPLDQRGTRRAARVKVSDPVGVMVDGNSAALVDISVIGAQIVSQAVLRPNQRVRMSLADQKGPMRFNASVAWASFEIPPNSGPRYRAGIEFIDADADALAAYCHRHKA